MQQGCTLLMLLFVIFQEPLYCALSSQKIQYFYLAHQKKLSFADDTSFIVANDEGIIECFSIIRKNELATGTNTKPNCSV